MRADIYLTNTSDKVMAVGMTSIAPGETKKVLKKDFERKASYISRMIKEKKLAFPEPGVETKVKEDVPAPAKDSTLNVDNNNVPKTDVANEESTLAGEDANSDSKQEKTDEADALNATENKEATDASEDTISAPEDDAAEKPEVVEEVPAPKRTQRKK